MAKRSMHIIFKALMLSAVALCGGQAQASGSWKALEVIDMTNSSKFKADMVVTTGFLHDLDFVSLDEPTLSLTTGGFQLNDTDNKKSGWAGLVEVEIKEDPTLPLDEISAFSDTFLADDGETKVEGFYTMQYRFDTGAPFRPYAGAGLGVVAQNSDTETAGIIAGRATAGFDLTLGEGTALFAEYEVIKNGGVTLGASGASDAATSATPDLEHSVKLGFRRNF